MNTSRTIEGQNKHCPQLSVLPLGEISSYSIVAATDAIDELTPSSDLTLTLTHSLELAHHPRSRVSTMASVTRQPFAPLDGTRLQNLTSLKNRQNGMLNRPARLNVVQWIP